MARRKRRGGRKGSKAFPILLAAPAVVPLAETGKLVLDKQLSISGAPEYLLWRATGYSASDQAFNSGLITRQLGLIIAGVVGHKVANKTGINRQMKKLTLGYLQF